jgi:hypothetical protein
VNCKVENEIQVVLVIEDEGSTASEVQSARMLQKSAHRHGLQHRVIVLPADLPQVSIARKDRTAAHRRRRRL